MDGEDLDVDNLITPDMKMLSPMSSPRMPHTKTATAQNRRQRRLSLGHILPTSVSADLMPKAVRKNMTTGLEMEIARLKALLQKKTTQLNILNGNK
jgi:hypothetical protein